MLERDHQQRNNESIFATVEVIPKHQLNVLRKTTKYIRG